MSLEKNYPVKIDILCYKLTFDGTTCILDSKESALEAIRDLLNEDDPGQEFKLEQVVYSNIELKNMKEFQGW